MRSSQLLWRLLSLIWSPVPAPHMEHMVIEWAARQQTGQWRAILVRAEDRACSRGSTGYRNAFWDVSSSIIFQGRVKTGSGRFILNPQVSSALYEAFLWFCSSRGAGSRVLQRQLGPVGSVRQGVVEDIGGYNRTRPSAALWTMTSKQPCFWQTRQCSLQDPFHSHNFLYNTLGRLTVLSCLLPSDRSEFIL